MNKYTQKHAALYISKMSEEVAKGNQEGIAENMYCLIANIACPETSDPVPFKWYDDYGIICDTKAAAEAVAGLINAVSGSTLCETGQKDEDEYFVRVV